MEDQYNNDELFNIVTRKRRGKKKSKSKLPTLKVNDLSETVNNLDLTDSVIDSDDERDNDDCKIAGNKDRSSVVSTDAMLAKSPEYEKKLEFPTDDCTVESELEPERENLHFNKRALSKFASTYELEKFEKNALVIFNQESIEGYKPRLGTEKDVAALKRTFSEYGFDVVEHKDLTKDEVFRELKTFSETDFTDYGCIAVAVLTHGSNNGLLRAKDQQYSEIEIINHFKVYDKHTLVTKPKILIIQACRGTKSMQGVTVFRAGKIRKDLDEALEPYTLPVEADMLVLHSSYVGNPSHRDELHGSWFIQSLCCKIEQLAPTHDLESIIVDVKREVAVDRYHEEYNRRTFEMDINKQMPVVTSTLIRKLYLKKYGDNPSLAQVSQNLTESSKSDVLDTAVPNTPLLVQFGPCSCFLDHFVYMRNCLRYFVEDHPEDETASSFLDVANSLEEGIEHNNVKEKLSKAICKHLSVAAKDCNFFKYIYFSKN